MSLTQTSLKRLEGVHPHLVTVVKTAASDAIAATDQPFQVIEGARSLSRQRELVRTGASRTLKSRHLVAPNGLAHAVDLVAMVGGRVSWEEPLYHRIAGAMKCASRQLGIPVEWGGDWRGFFDGPHFQLPWDIYPGVVAIADPPVPRPTEREMATLVPGSRGEAVADLQRALVAAGHAVDVDGDFGPETRAAVLAAQAALGRKVTGLVTTADADAIRRAGKRSQ